MRQIYWHIFFCEFNYIFQIWIYKLLFNFNRLPKVFTTFVDKHSKFLLIWSCICPFLCFIINRLGLFVIKIVVNFIIWQFHNFLSQNHLVLQIWCIRSIIFYLKWFNFWQALFDFKLMIMNFHLYWSPCSLAITLLSLRFDLVQFSFQRQTLLCFKMLSFSHFFIYIFQ